MLVYSVNMGSSLGASGSLSRTRRAVSASLNPCAPTDMDLVEKVVQLTVSTWSSLSASFQVPAHAHDLPSQHQHPDIFPSE